MPKKTKGFTLTEVMILSLVLMLGVFGITEVIDKSLAQQQQSRRQWQILSSLDSWIQEIIHSSQSKDSLPNPSTSHSKLMERSPKEAYLLQWDIQRFQGGIRQIHYQVVNPVDQSLLHEGYTVYLERD